MKAPTLTALAGLAAVGMVLGACEMHRDYDEGSRHAYNQHYQGRDYDHRGEQRYGVRGDEDENRHRDRRYYEDRD